MFISKKGTKLTNEHFFWDTWYIGKPQNSQASITPTAQTMNDKTKLTLPCGLLLVKISLFVVFSHQQPCPYTCQKMVTVKF